MIDRIKRIIGPVLSVVLFVAALWMLHHELRLYHFHEIAGYIKSISAWRILAAAGLTFLSYSVMTGYDTLAIRYIRHPLAYRKIGLASFTGYAFSNNIGLSMLAGASVRYRLYSAWGFTTFEIAQVVAFCSLTFWLGFLVLGGLVFVIEPTALPSAFHIPFGSMHILGFVMLGIACAYAGFSFSKKKILKIRDFELQMPPTALISLQIGVAVLDWILAGSVLFVLLGPLEGKSFFSFLQIFMLAQFSGLISQVPGGMGIFESVTVVLLSARHPAALIFASLLVYRVIYYWLPLAVAVLLLGGQEVVRHKAMSLRLIEIFGRWVSPVLPQVLGIAAMVGGSVLLFSGAIPALEDRLDFLKFILPLPLIEFSHFIGSIAGMGLILLGRGLQRRLDVAWVLTLALLVGGIFSSLFKGLDYEEAIILALIGAGLLPNRRYFYRKSSLFNERFNAGWGAAILIIVSASIWLGLIAYRHVEYTHSLWWQFAFSGNISRFLRGTIGAISLALFFAMYLLFRPMSARHHKPEPDELEKAEAIVRESTDTAGNLSLLGDKSFIFSENNRAFIMYGVEGRNWISMGDPVGPLEEWPELAWRFRELADKNGGRTVFYEAGHENLYIYLDMGLSLIKIGEEARVSLSEFSLEGGHRKMFRNTKNKLEKEGCRFALMTPEEVAANVNEFKEISDAWLAEKNAVEKKFSLGSFSFEYIQRFPAAVVYFDNKLVAFANLWQGADLEELSTDLMRYRPRAPHGVMEYLFIQTMLWGKQQGYKWFNLGMAPLSGLENRNLAPIWNRLGSFIFQHGENFYNFQGLRQYKEKFNPVWRPKYLASPGGIATPQVFAGLLGLISGGIKGIVSK